MKALWNGQVIAESDETVVVEGNHYFPPGSVRREFLELRPAEWCTEPGERVASHVVTATA